MSKGLQLLLWWPSRQQSEKDQASGTLSRLRCEVINAQGRAVSREECLPAELPRNLPVTLMLHPDDVSLLPVNVPDVRGKKSAEALAYATEPLVLADVDDLFISAHGRLSQYPEPGNWQTVACIDRLRARAILAAAAALGLSVQRVSCEPLFFDIRGRDHWLIDTTSGVWVCSGSAPPWLLATEEIRSGAARLKRWLSQQGEAAARSSLVLISSTPSAGAHWKSCTDMTVDVINRDALTPVSTPAQLLPERDMRLTGGARGAGPSRWRRTQQLAAATATLALVLLNLSAQRVRSADQAIDAAIEEAFVRAMPNTPMVADPLLMLERARLQLTQTGQGGSSAFTRLLHAGATQMQALPFNSVNLVSYDGNTLQMSFSADVADAQRREIDNNLRGQQIRSAWQTDDKKRTRVTLTWIKN